MNTQICFGHGLIFEAKGCVHLGMKMDPNLGVSNSDRFLFLSENCSMGCDCFLTSFPNRMTRIRSPTILWYMGIPIETYRMKLSWHYWYYCHCCYYYRRQIHNSLTILTTQWYYHDHHWYRRCIPHCNHKNVGSVTKKVILIISPYLTITVTPSMITLMILNHPYFDPLLWYKQGMVYCCFSNITQGCCKHRQHGEIKWIHPGGCHLVK